MISTKTFWNATLATALAIGILGCGASGGASTETKEPTKAPEATTTETASARKLPTVEGNKAGDVIKIGIVASLNGENRPWGVDSVAGAQLAIDEVNAAGGIGGKKLQLLQGDSNSKAEQGKSAAEKLISDGALVLLGEVASGITMQMSQAAFEKGVPVIAIGATRTDISADNGALFRVCYTDAFQGPVMAKFAFDELGLKKVALITDKKLPYSTGLSDSFRAYFTKLGGEIVDEQFYESGQTDFKGILTSVKTKQPDGLFLSGYFTETGPLAKQSREAGLNVKLLGGDGWDSKEILNSGGDAILGSFFCNHYNNKEARPEVQSFLDKWKAKYPSNPEPATTMGALGYDSAILAIDALKRVTGEITSKALTEQIEATESFKAVSGNITLKGNKGDPPKRALVVELTKDGQVFRKAYEASEIK
ncbi:MAG: ABC transporter substrate-binding protein [Fimbriimonas sp.]